MRVTATEYGTSGNSEMVRAYQRIYTQPLHNYLISKAFRLWVTCAWRVYALKDKIVWKDEDLLGSLIRVEIKEHYLSVKNIKEISMTYGPEYPNSQADNWKGLIRAMRFRHRA